MTYNVNKFKTNYLQVQPQNQRAKNEKNRLPKKITEAPKRYFLLHSKCAGAVGFKQGQTPALKPPLIGKSAQASLAPSLAS